MNHRKKRKDKRYAIGDASLFSPCYWACEHGIDVSDKRKETRLSRPMLGTRTIDSGQITSQKGVYNLLQLERTVE